MRMLQNSFRQGKTITKSMKVKDCLPILIDIELEKLVNEEEVTEDAVRAVEEVQFYIYL